MPASQLQYHYHCFDISIVIGFQVVVREGKCHNQPALLGWEDKKKWCEMEKDLLLLAVTYPFTYLLHQVGTVPLMTTDDP